MRAFSIVPRKPRLSSSKSRVSENGSALSVAACCATTEAEASLGFSLETVWVMAVMAKNFLCGLRGTRGEIRRIGDRPGRHRLHPKNLPQMHFVRAVADAQQPPPGQCLMDRRIIGAAHRAEYLHRAVGDPLQHRGNGDLDQRDVAPILHCRTCAVMAGLVEQPRAAVRQ